MNQSKVSQGFKMYHLLFRRLSILYVLFFSQQCSAIPLAVNFEGAFVPGGGMQPLPIYVDNNEPNPDSVRFRFSVPQAGLIQSLNSVRIDVDVYDDADNPNNETGNVVFSLASSGNPNFVVASFESGLNGTSSAAPLTVGDFVSPSQLADALAEIQDDGIFFVRLNRNGGDYFVQRATVVIDATLLPEPSVLEFAGIGLPLLTCWCYRGRDTCRVTRYKTDVGSRDSFAGSKSKR